MIACLMTYVNGCLIDVIFLVSSEKEDDLERRFVLLDQELRDILSIEGNVKFNYLLTCCDNLLYLFFFQNLIT